MFQKIKDKKKAKELEKLISQLPLWNIGARNKGYPDWESFVLDLRLATPEQIEEIHTAILMKGWTENGRKSLLRIAPNGQDNAFSENGC